MPPDGIVARIAARPNALRITISLILYLLPKADNRFY